MCRQLTKFEKDLIKGERARAIRILNEFKAGQCDELNKNIQPPVKTTNKLILSGKRRFCGVCYTCTILSLLRDKIKKDL